MQKVVKWVRKGGLVDAFCSTTARSGKPAAFGLLHAAAVNGHLELVRELLKRGARVDLPNSLSGNALMNAAHRGHHFILLVLLQHSANPDLQSNNGVTALMWAARDTWLSRRFSGSTPRRRSLPPPRLPPHRTLASPR